jgi:hypothetical protein
MKDITDIFNEIIAEGYGNTAQFGDISRDGQFIDYFGTKLSTGDKIIFLAQDFRESKDFYRAEVGDLITDKGGIDYVIVKNVESPFTSGGKVKNGSKKRSDLCVKINI